MADPIPTPAPAPVPAPSFWAANRAVLTHALVAFLSVLLTAVATWLGVSPKVVEVIREVPVVLADDVPAGDPAPEARRATGWVRDPESVQAVAATLPNPVFSTTPAGQVGAVPAKVYLWDLSKALGIEIPTRDQLGVGSCVAFGAACAVEYQELVQIAAAGTAGRPAPEFKSVSQEVIYGGSRVQIGGGQIRGDGSVGAWAAKFSRDYGAVARGVYGRYDLTVYNERTCRQFGNSGCPAALVPEAKQHPTKSISLIRTPADAKKALASLYPLTIASDVGFGNRGPWVRNAKGQLRASGEWAHQMCCIGYDRDSGFLIMNSWGPSWVSGPSGPGNPPPGSFYVDEATFARMLSQGDSWAYGDQVGFPARDSTDDWFIRDNAPRRQPELLALSWSLAP